MKRHKQLLLNKWKKTVYQDDSGENVYDDWNKEVEIFIQNMAFPRLNLSPSSLQERKNDFNRYWPILVAENEQEEKDPLKKCMRKHFKTLFIKRKQTIYEDDYGRVIYDDWYKEVDYFLRNIAFPGMSAYHSSLPEIEKKFDSYWGKLIEEYEYNEQEVSVDIPVRSGLDYEHYVERYFQNLGYDVTRTPKTGDQGVDLICEKDNMRWAVQCKYYSKPVGNKAVQEVIAGANFYKCDVACVCSNAQFTKSARQLAENSDVRLINVIPE
jgi:hypothetical protein